MTLLTSMKIHGKFIMYTKISITGTKIWCLDPELRILHREDGPAVEYSNGDKFWYINGNLHREDGPAIEYKDGYKSWCINGKLHREDGPAIELFSGLKTYYFNDKHYLEIETDREWIKFLKLKNFW